MEESIDAIAAVVEALELAALSGADARRLAELFARGERLCAAGKLLAARRVSDSATWTGGGVRSVEEWLAALSGTSVGSAGSALDTAERLAGQPALEDAVKSGEVSLAQAGEIAQAAKAAAKTDPHAGEKLIKAAKSGVSMKSLKDQCRRAATTSNTREDDQARNQRLRRERYFKTWVDSEGAGRGQFKLAPGDFARFMAWFKPFQDQAFENGRTAGSHDSYAAYGADGLLAMAQAAHDGGEGGEGEGGAGGGGGSKAKGSATVIAIVDLAALRRGAVGVDETCEIVGVGPVPVSALDDLLGDAFFAAAIVDGVDIRRVVHLGRSATALQRTALWVRDRACVHCGGLHNLEIDHVDQWSGTQRTQLDQLAFLCRACHHLKTHRGWKLVGTPGSYKLLAPHPPPS